MNRLPVIRWLGFTLCLFGVATGHPGLAQPADSASPAGAIVIVEVEGRVEVVRAGAQQWDPAYTNQVLQVGDRVRTRENSRVTLLVSGQSVARFGRLSEFAIDSPVAPNKQPGFSLTRGLLYFFHRDKPAGIRINTRTAAAAINGTEFNLAAEESGRTVLTMLDGEVELSNAQGTITLKSGEQGSVEVGQGPVKTAVIYSINVIQWALYYPAILDLDELVLGQPERQLLEPSLNAYRSGDLLRALAEYPPGRTAVAAAEKVYLGSLLLAVGQVEQTEALFDLLPQNGGAGAANDSNIALAGAVRQLIAAVKLQQRQRGRAPELASEWLAESYSLQAQSNLTEALRAARRAVEKSPNFGFGWARVAELEFSFGHVPAAVEALEKSLKLAPRNAEALALKGFLLGAQNKIHEAITFFDRAMGVDGALANAWLGRGLCRIRRGEVESGRRDLLVAAALEPQRALLRSYLGKAYSDAGDKQRAAKELDLARKLDPKDPTSWLYLALLEQRNNQINDAVRDLEKSQELNDNRQVYRSKLLLDQDRAVRSANLANVYRDAGMFDVSVREAGRAVSYDYANYAAHLFLAGSYDQLRDPNLINLRYETPANSEYLVANLLAPVGAGPLSPTISQQEYSKLFERDHLGLVSSTEYLSRGAWTESGAQFGTFGNFSYSLEAFYRSDPGQRPNNDLEERQVSLALKQQLTPRDTVSFQAIQTELSGGDLFQYYDQRSAARDLRFKEKQEPILTFGYHHEWNPGTHTLFLAARLNDRFSFTNSAQGTLLGRNRPLTAVDGLTMREDFQGKLEIYSAELQQIWQQPRHTTIVGARFQSGRFDTKNLQTQPSTDGAFFPDPPNPAVEQEVSSHFRRASVYAYHSWQLAESFQVTGGLAYDRITFPENFRTAPLSEAEETVARVSPKAGFIWTPGKATTVRFAYTRALSGVSLDQSFQLEPSQVAGFLQSYRSVIPESVAGANAGARIEAFGLSIEQKLRRETYLGIAGEILNSKVRRTVGTFLSLPMQFDTAIPSGLREHLDYEERSVIATLNQLIGNEWSFGAQYRLSQAVLLDDFVTVPASATVRDFQPRQDIESILHQLGLHAIYTHPSGFFGQLQALWYLQSNAGYRPDRPGDSFWHLNAFAGYRFPGRKAEISIGGLNLGDRDYHLNPLTLYNELPRGRTFVGRFQFSF